MSLSLIGLSENRMTQRKRGAALDKALTILDAIVNQRRPVGLAYLAEELALTKPTIHRVLLQLEEAQLIQRAPDKDRYWIGPRLNGLSATVLGSLNQPYPTRAILRALVDELGETCNVGVLDQHEVQYIDRVESNFPLRFELRAGSRVPAHCTAIGKLLLAYLPQESRRRLLAVAPLTGFTDNTIVDDKRFEWELSRIRQQGYSANNEEYINGLIAVAVPIVNSSGHAIAAVAVHAPAARLTLQQAISTIPNLQSAAEKFADIWGLREPETGAAAVKLDPTA